MSRHHDTPQAGIFALGTASHAYLEFDLHAGGDPRDAISTLGPVAGVAGEVSSWPYRHDRDLTGFIDGTENPSLALAPDIALVPSDAPGAGGSVLLLQRWTHDVESWEALAVEAQERTMGRTKDDSTELEDRPEDSHVARTDQEDFGDIFRRNTPYGTVTDHGTMFVGFAAEQGPLARMLASMAGIDGPRDALTRYTTPLTGAYYFVPSAPALLAFASDPEAG
jgi:putative iron-dependent peroxidase